MYEKVPHDAVAKDEELLTEKATVMLDRVRVMRVFDFAGLVEAIGEVSEICERKTKMDEEKKQQLSARSGQTTREVLDSQDEGDEDDEYGDATNVETVHETTNKAEGSGPATCEVRVGSLEGDTAAIGVMVVDTVTNIISSLMAKSQVQGTYEVHERVLKRLTLEERPCACHYPDQISSPLVYPPQHLCPSCQLSCWS